MHKIGKLELKEKPQEFFTIRNDSCLVCGKKFLAPSGIVLHKGVGICLECYMSLYIKGRD